MFLAYIWFIFLWKYLQWNIHIYFHKQLLFEHVKQSSFSGISPIPQKVSHKKTECVRLHIERRESTCITYNDKKG